MSRQSANPSSRSGSDRASPASSRRGTTLRSLSLIATSLAAILVTPAAAQVPIEPSEVFQFLDLKVNANVIETEIVVKKTAMYRFVRLKCDTFDASNKSLGSYFKDFGSHSAAGVMASAGDYWRPTMRLPLDVENADHASCKFATKDDSLPSIDPS